MIWWSFRLRVRWLMLRRFGKPRLIRVARRGQVSIYWIDGKRGKFPVRVETIQILGRGSDAERV
jgi:hypothetical protein